MRTFTFVLCELAGAPVIGSVEVVNEIETRKSPVASAPGASGPYGFDRASAVTPDGGVSETVPLCDVVDQLWTSTGTVIVSPALTVWIAAERASRRAGGAVCSSQLSYSAQLPQRWKRPSTGETTRTTSSV